MHVFRSRRRARSSRLPWSPFGDSPAGLTEGGQPVVCWPARLNPGLRKKFRVGKKKLSRIRLQAAPRSPACLSMTRTSNLNPDNILRFLQVRREPTSPEEIAAALHVRKADLRPLLKMLAKLKKRRALEGVPGGKYRLPGRKSEGEAGEQPVREPSRPASFGAGIASRDEVKGRLVLHHDGDGFVVPDTPVPQLDGGVFGPRDAI